MDANKLEILSLQFAISLKKPIFSPESIFSDLDSDFGGIFADNPKIEPVPFVPGDDNLLNIPIVVSTSSDGLNEMHLSRGRVDFFRHASIDEVDYSDVSADFKTKVAIVSNFVLTKLKMEIDWIGFVFAYRLKADTPTSAVTKIINNSFLDLNSGEPSGFFVRNTNKIQVGEVSANNLFICGSGQFQKKGEDTLVNAVMINQDFNTKVSKNVIDIDFINNFLDNSSELIKSASISALL